MKTVYIIRGLPGSGKSTIAEHFKFIANQSNISFEWIETDKSFIQQNGDYVFDKAKLHSAHQYWMARFKKSVNLGVDMIVVSNTSTRKWEFEEYMKYAEDNGYIVHVMIAENYHKSKNLHGVPDEKIEQMKKRFEMEL